MSDTQADRTDVQPPHTAATNAQPATAAADSQPAATAAAGRFATARMLARGWWLFLLRGVVGILFGLLALLVPGVGLAFILGFLSAFLAIDGISSIAQAVRGGADPQKSKTWLWIDGIASVVAAAALLLLPVVSAVVLVLMVGSWSIVVGIMRLVLAFRSGSVMLGLMGALAILVGAWMVVAPGPGLLALIWLVAFQAFFAGALFIGLGWRLRRIAHDPHGPETEGARA
jgi:uncharacterized membrane protein HdeD (DUF308 family)